MFILPPETKDREITYTIPADVDAYFKEWYLDTKKDGESPGAFTYRQMAKAGLAYRKQKVIKAEADVIRSLIDSIDVEHNTVVLDNSLD